MKRLAWGIATVIGLVAGYTGCTAVLDRKWEQCHTDADCSQFGPHPVCQSGVCVEKGLGPEGCFFGQPQSKEEFLNQCSAATCIPYDDCAHGLCDAGLSDGDDGGNLKPDPIPPNPPTALAPSMGSCKDQGSVVYMAGSSNFVPLLKQITPLLINHIPKLTPVFQLTSSCRGIQSLFKPDSPDKMLRDPPMNASFPSYYDVTGLDPKGKPIVSAMPCSVGSEGIPIDIGESEIYSDTCGYAASSMESLGIGEFLGPNIAILFVVPRMSLETSISAEAARFVFGRGARGAPGLPWNDPTLYFVRNQNTATQQLVAHSIGVDASQFWGKDQGSADNVDGAIRLISDPATSQQAIGLLSTDFYDTDRGNLNALAFKAKGQSCGYYPDSTFFNKDKRNVRDGHYPIWGPFHFFTKVGVDRQPLSQVIKDFLGIVTVELPPLDLLNANIDSSLVPDCAMMVKRTTEVGPLTPYSPAFHCGCYFDARVNSGSAPADCKVCTAQSECPAARPACNFGYCEVR